MRSNKMLWIVLLDHFSDVVVVAIFVVGEGGVGVSIPLFSTTFLPSPSHPLPFSWSLYFQAVGVGHMIPPNLPPNYVLALIVVNPSAA